MEREKPDYSDNDMAISENSNGNHVKVAVGGSRSSDTDTVRFNDLDILYLTLHKR